MKIKRTKQVSLTQITDIDFDIFILASGYESRASFLASYIEKENVKCKSKIVFGFKEAMESPVRTKNDNIFKKLTYEITELSGNDVLAINELLGSLNRIDSEEINILIDYSCMTRVWYAHILKYLHVNEINKRVHVYFSYTPSQYVESSKAANYNKHVSPLDGFYSVSIPDRPTALIIGLGYIELRAYGLSEFFDVQPHLFIADSSSSLKYHCDVLSNNSRLINSVPAENLSFYPLHNLLLIESQLSNLCLDLMSNYRVVLAPCGPKPFTLSCLLTSLRMGGIDVWRISGGDNEPMTDKVASGEVSILEVLFA